MTLKFYRWPWKTTGHLFYAHSSFLHHFVAIHELQFELQSRNGPIGFCLCDLDLWPLTLTFCMDITFVNGNNMTRTFTFNIITAKNRSQSYGIAIFFWIDPHSIFIPGFQGNSYLIYTKAAFEALHIGTCLCQNQQWHDVSYHYSTWVSGNCFVMS